MYTSIEISNDFLTAEREGRKNNIYHFSSLLVAITNYHQQLA